MREEGDKIARDVITEYRNFPGNEDNYSLDEYFYKVFVNMTCNKEDDYIKKNKHRMLIPEGMDC